MFWTCAAAIASLDELGGVAVLVFGVNFFDEPVGGCCRTDGNCNAVGVIAGANVCGLDRLFGLGHELGRDVVDVSGVVFAAGNMDDDAFGVRGIIWATGARRGVDEDETDVSIVFPAMEVSSLLEEAVVCGSFGFGCCSMGIARLADASIVSFVGWVFGSSCDDDEVLAQMTGLSGSGSERNASIDVINCPGAKYLNEILCLDTIPNAIMFSDNISSLD